MTSTMTGLLCTTYSLPGQFMPGSPSTGVPTSASVAGPISGMWQNAVTFTVQLNAPLESGALTVTPAISISGDTIMPLSTTIRVGQTSASFTLTPSSYGYRSIATTISPGPPDPGSPWTYNAYEFATGYLVEITDGLVNGGGHQNTTATGTITLTPAGSTCTGTITATPGVGEGNLYNPFTTTFNNEFGPKSFSFEPTTSGPITFSFTTVLSRSKCLVY